MFTIGGKLIVKKPFFKLRELIKSYRADYHAYGEHSPFVVHFRFATHGKRDERNTHPHVLDCGDVALAHNGILHVDGVDYDSSRESDTVYFCRTVLAQRTAERLMSVELRDLLADMIGLANKFVLLSADGQMSIINENSGHWDGGNWFSNMSHEERRVPLWEPCKYDWWKKTPGSSRGAIATHESLCDFDPVSLTDSELDTLAYHDALTEDEQQQLTDAQYARYQRIVEMERELDYQLATDGDCRRALWEDDYTG